MIVLFGKDIFCQSCCNIQTNEPDKDVSENSKYLIKPLPVNFGGFIEGAIACRIYAK